jgi:hypothetical protein
MRIFIFLCISLCMSKNTFAQLNAADSSLFYNIFNQQRYIDTIIYPGNWYQFGQVSSVYNHYLIMDTNFKFKTLDLDSMNYLNIATQLKEDTTINNTFNMYPSMLSQSDPLVYLPFSLSNRTANSYAYRTKDTNQTDCKNAFYIIPGNGQNQSLDIEKGIGYHNQLCFMKNHCLQYGDVYTFIKPNHEARAFHWNGYRMNEDYLLYYLISANTRYGINYLVEIIAMLKYLKTNYDKVFILGLSEGGYSTLLATMYEQPDAALISGGYSIDLDTNTIENDFLRSRFDYLLDTFNRVKVKDKITYSATNYLFTWGENDPVPTMDPEHDFHYTQNYFGPLNNCSYFYDFYDHTFPPCVNIDTFIQRNLAIPLAHFEISDTTLVDTLVTTVKFCRSGLYQFDLYKNDTLSQSYSLITDSVHINLIDSGKYYITNIVDSNLSQGKCRDTIQYVKIPAVANALVNEMSNNSTVQYNNPVREQLNLRLTNTFSFPVFIQVLDVFGVQVYYKNLNENNVSIDFSHWSSGLYFINLRNAYKEPLAHLKVMKL